MTEFEKCAAGCKPSKDHMPVIDCHAHVMNSINGIKQVIGLTSESGFDAVNILSLAGMGDMAQNPICMLFKSSLPGKGYIFGGLNHNDYTSGEMPDYLTQVKKLIDMGFDGMKMIEGKPTVRKKLGMPLNAPCLYQFYSYLEHEGIPVLFHVADPETFWNIKEVPQWAFENGWFYGDGTYVEKEELYSEIEDILTRFPGLKAIFAHFYFLSGDLDRAAGFLDKWENANFDLTPGTEMYVNFSRNTDKWRDFFIKYQDRILFGTDNCDAGNPLDLDNIHKTVYLSRRFLETEGPFKVWDLELNGIGLDKDVLEKIYMDNFLKLVGPKPKKLNFEMAMEECHKIAVSALETGKRQLSEVVFEIEGKLRAIQQQR